MPMKIKLTERTTVTDDFWPVVIDLWKQRWKALNDEIRQADPVFKKTIVNRNSQPMGLLRAYCTDATALDGQKTQLMTLPYVKFWIEEHKGSTWLAGLTKPIVLVDNESRKYQGPRYFVYIPVGYIETGTGGRYHFVPEGRELEYARHPHHNANRPRADITSPLEMTPNTCWGEFPTIVKGCQRTADTVSLFRTLHLYLSRVNMHSLLTSWSQCVQFTPLTSNGRSH